MTPSLKQELPESPQLSALRNVDPEKTQTTLPPQIPEPPLDLKVPSNPDPLRPASNCTIRRPSSLVPIYRRRASTTTFHNGRDQRRGLQLHRPFRYLRDASAPWWCSGACVHEREDHSTLAGGHEVCRKGPVSAPVKITFGPGPRLIFFILGLRTLSVCLENS